MILKLLVKGDKRRAEEIDRAYQDFQRLNEESALFLRMKKPGESRGTQKFAIGELEKFLLNWVGDMLFSGTLHQIIGQIADILFSHLTICNRFI